jgi:anti-sigma regulatory factor (Ser/Thr protein kinase)
MRLTVKSSVDELPMVMDADKMRNVINNLLSNSFKFTPDGGDIKVSIDRGGDGMIQIRVSDTGQGIPKENRDRIFERYYMSKRGATNTGSSGLGLNIVKHYVELHGGTVKAGDNEPSGAVFTILLPETQKSAVSLPEEKPLEQTTEEKKNLLIVEDNADMLSYMTSVLSADYTVFQATEGRQALEILHNTDIDVVVSDVMMEGMDGLQLTRTIKSDVDISHVPIILL